MSDHLSLRAVVEDRVLAWFAHVSAKARMSQPGSEDTEPEAILNNRANFLLAELGHFEQAFLQNEQMGEGRFRFFLTLITAAITGLVALHTAKDEIIDGQQLQPIVMYTLGLLWLFGLLTYLRMLQRDRVNEGYKQDLKHIRGLLRDELRLTNYEVPFSPHASSTEKELFSPEWWERRLRAGYTQTVGAICVLLMGMLVLYLFQIGKFDWLFKVNPLLVYLGVLIFFVVLSFVASHIAVINRDKAEERARSEYFRAGVGAVIVKDKDLVLAFKRADTDDDVWQVPQGGLRVGEKPLKAAYREVLEETGIRRQDLKSLGTYPEPLAYELPVGDRSEKTGRGQVHCWFYFEFRGSEDTINVKKGGEFRDWDWITFHDLPSSAVAFRRPVYQRLYEQFRENIATKLAF
jgi:putative (di)nucleoside polyphosphate hydrolase